ncbi:hypothetical protein AMATHDRAFT_79160, partial [Amanita thiersii Skay4041]
MHYRNPYQRPLDFFALAEVYSPLKPHLRQLVNIPGCYTIDFFNNDSQRRLTEALLYRDYGLTISLPNNRLCPPVPNRLNYILWLQDIARAHDRFIDTLKGDVYGIDVGTGASAIYPLLGCKTDSRWNFFATEIDDVSYCYARQNVEANRLGDRICLVKTTAPDPILLPLEDPTRLFDFTMCNPPFYTSKEEIMHSSKAKELPPNAICNGAEVEMITPGGELAFVGRIIEESKKYITRCKWYTSMLGKLSSVAELVKLLRQNEIVNYALAEFVQGQTRRWAIAWSFTDTHLPDSMARIPNPSLQSSLPQHNTLQYKINIRTSRLSVTEKGALQQLGAILLQTINMIEAVTICERRWEDSHSSPSGRLALPQTMLFTVVAQHNTWSRSARRRVQQQKGSDQERLQQEPATNNLQHSMTCGIELSYHVLPDTMTLRMQLVFQWIYGRDRSLFESFVNHV